MDRPIDAVSVDTERRNRPGLTGLQHGAQTVEGLAHPCRPAGCVAPVQKPTGRLDPTPAPIRPIR